MWASMNGNKAQASSSSSSSASSLFFGAPAPAAASSAAPSLPPVQTFKFNFSAPADDGEEQNEEMSNDEPKTSSHTAAADDVPAPLILQRPAVQHFLSPHAAAPTRDELELLTLHASSTFTVAPLNDAAPAASSSSSSSAAAAAPSASASSSLGAPVLRFLKRRSKPAATHAALASMLAESDLLPAVYEGGFKVWECSVDLVLLLQRHMPTSSLFPAGLGGLRVAELGCGHALPGIFALQHGAGYVALQDYNAEVVEDVLVENTWCNLRGIDAALAANGVGAASSSSTAAPAKVPMASHADDAELNRRVGFFSGDWRDPALLEMMIAGGGSGGGLFDLILTSDTLYSCAYMAPLLSALDRLLSPTGQVLVAAKRYYFGIGGSTMEFSDLARNSGKWEVQVVDTIEDGRSNIREILHMRRRKEGGSTCSNNAAAAIACKTTACAAME